MSRSVSGTKNWSSGTRVIQWTKWWFDKQSQTPCLRVCHRCSERGLQKGKTMPQKQKSDLEQELKNSHT